MSIIDNAIYVRGQRVASPTSAADTVKALSEHQDGMAWLGLCQPDEAEMDAVADLFELPALAVEDAIMAHQRSKVERYENIFFAVLHPAKYLDEEEEVIFGELHIFAGENFVITVRHFQNDVVSRTRARLESQPELLSAGPIAVTYALFDQVVDNYFPVDAGLENDIYEIEDQLFGSNMDVSQRIYKLSREVMHLQRALNPLLDMTKQLKDTAEQEGHQAIQHSLRDVLDHVQRLSGRADSHRDILQNALTVDGTLTSNRLAEASARQSEQAKRISAWAAIFFTPTFVTGIYGMNFTHMPELNWPIGYPVSFVVMFVLAFIVWWVFKRKSWL